MQPGELDDLELPRPGRGRKIRFTIVIAFGLLSTFAWVYMRYIMVKSPLGGPCEWAMQCGKDAPKCMRESLEGDGVCSRECAVGTDCAPGIRCVQAEIDQYDERGTPTSGGFCFPQTFLDHKKALDRANKRR